MEKVVIDMQILVIFLVTNLSFSTSVHKLSDVVHMDLNVLGSLLLNWIIVDSNGTLIITIDSN